MKNYLIDGKSLDLKSLHTIASADSNTVQVRLCPKALVKMKSSNDYVEKIAAGSTPVYGINTGFGALSSKHIAKEDLAQLQINLIRSHCTGVGKPFSREITRAIMLLRANCLASGYSGVTPSIVELLLEFLNNDIIPVVPEKGSVGASGDLAPLSHVALCLIGEGQVTYSGKIVRSDFAIDQIGQSPAKLGPKDGLALINGTAVMTALGAFALEEAFRLIKISDIVTCFTLDGVKGTHKAYDPLISSLKPHQGQLDVCHNLNTILKGSELLHSHDDCNKVQDPYSLRCVPQVHGSCRQTLTHAKEVIDTELNSVTDNPLIFVEEDKVVSGGNFHGEALALCMDYLCMGLSELANISERRIEKMMNPSFSELPAFLTPNSGLNSGLMIAQVTAAALASENKYLCHPASVDSIPTSTDKEDHVSMGVTSGRKLQEVLFNLKNVLAIEFLCASQALHFQRPLKTSAGLENVYSLIRKHVPPIDQDRVFKEDIDNIVKLINTNEIVNAVEKVTGELL